jgi:hypothetical protein
MRKKLLEIVKSYSNTRKTIYFGNKKVVIKERFSNNVVKEYRITSIFVDDNDECSINYICFGENNFVHSSYMKDLSNTFIAQLLTELI